MKRLLEDLISRFKTHDVFAMGSQLAFNLVLSFFPFIIFLMTLVGHISLNANVILMGLSRIMPESAFSLISTMVSEVITSKHSHLMSFSLILTVWSSSAGFNAVIKGLNKAYGVSESRGFVRVRIVSIFCTLGMAFIILIMMFLLILGRTIWNFAANLLGFSDKLFILWTLIRYSIFISTTIFIIAALYRYAPSKRLSWKEVLPGSLFSTLDLIIESMAFAYYVNNFASYSIVYGSVGAIIILLLWLFIIGITIILGGEINASLSYRGDIRTVSYTKTIKG